MFDYERKNESIFLFNKIMTSWKRHATNLKCASKVQYAEENEHNKWIDFYNLFVNALWKRNLEISLENRYKSAFMKLFFIKEIDALYKKQKLLQWKSHLDLFYRSTILLFGPDCFEIVQLIDPRELYRILSYLSRLLMLLPVTVSTLLGWLYRMVKTQGIVRNLNCFDGNNCLLRNESK